PGGAVLPAFLRRLIERTTADIVAVPGKTYLSVGAAVALAIAARSFFAPRVDNVLSTTSLRLGPATPAIRMRRCHSKMRSSYSSKVESSCSKPANWPDERTGDAGVKHQRSGSAEGFA